ncbi:glucokinase [Rhizorhabdus dicambivorans]|uniref:Glucokinase n=2 Tax=Rhizorhabdus dicambivorans TaxID=1850238 RepID=A0A2A4FYP2_9SPHN|nr:ROK family protein [Rhizorhabdus dicambivorans]ATE67059.1 glucokinase [Rhizorhabdus dicambivorans]PCE43338.1 glucokinase [Rhizorhabdus dicambivorans]
MTELVAVDLGGTHARFAIAELHGDRRPSLGPVAKYRTADYPGLPAAWAAFAEAQGGALPKAASIAIAGPVEGELIRFTNNGWTIRPATLAAELGVERLSLLNDFAAMAAAVGVLDEDELIHLGGPQGPLPAEGVTTVIGPGTGLGVAQLLRRRGRRIVLATEGGHIDFAALDGFEEKLLARLRERHRRVSVERIVSGPALADIHETLALLGGRAIVPRDDAALWQAATDGSDPLAAEALDRLVMAFGAVAGDLALAHGAHAVVITGGLANRIEERLRGPLFHDRFRAKGRFEHRMATFPIRLARHAEAGLLGAAAAFQEDQ